MLSGLFVTGTDTGVGKTIVSAALVHQFRRRGPVRYWKPVQTGIEEDDDTATVRRLAACRAEEIFEDGVRLPRPLSPHASARLAGVTITIDDILRRIAGQGSPPSWIVEGAGGVLVPLNDRQLMIDLMVRLALPVVVAARSGLGTINHTLLTLEALAARGLTVAGVVMNGPLDPSNRAAIETYGHVAVIGELPPLDPLAADTLSACAESFRLDRA
ncbi:MAG TPA: dethiobiotin synthase [Vicinamibacterales bacterium]